MGLLRFFLALAVVIQHTSGTIFGIRTMNGPSAVQTFFIISGFYMTMILREKYRGPGSYKLFLTNRLLRLFPAYWCAVGATLLMGALIYIITGTPIGWRRYYYDFDLAPISWVCVAAANFAIFGQDWLLFFDRGSTGCLQFTPGLHLMANPAHHFLLDPPAWSLGTELTFYLAAPLLLRRSLKTILLCIGASLSLRLTLIFGLGLYQDPWNYRFFPTELALFLFGAVSYHIYDRVKHAPVSYFQWVAMIAFALVTVGFQNLPDWRPADRISLRAWGYYAFACMAVPLLFHATRNIRIDRYLGELSYPIYIVHMPVFWLLAWMPRIKLFAKMGHWTHWLTLVGSIAVSCLLLHWLIYPIERIRQRRVAKAPPPIELQLQRAA